MEEESSCNQEEGRAFAFPTWLRHRQTQSRTSSHHLSVTLRRRWTRVLVPSQCHKDRPLPTQIFMLPTCSPSCCQCQWVSQRNTMLRFTLKHLSWAGPRAQGGSSTPRPGLLPANRQRCGGTS